jgi:serine protease Do
MKKVIISVLLLTAVHYFSGQAKAQQLREMFSKTNPSVVVIRTVERRVSPQMQAGMVSLPGLGSGVLISNDGKILTAAHVVQAADQIAVEFVDGKQARARVTGSYPRADIAILQLEWPMPGLVPAKLADSDSVQVGDDVFIIGAPYGLSHSLTVGHVSGKHTSKELAGVSKVEMFQTDAAINQGNSGGPMFNMAGEVIGIVSQIISNTGGFQGLGFAVTSNVARKLLLNKNSFWTGIDGYLLTNELARIFNLPQPAGVLVMRTAENSPASDLGLIAGTIPTNIGGTELVLGGDIILEVAGIPIVEDWKTLDEMQAALGSLQTGEKYTLKVLRGGVVVELKAYVRAK